MTGHDARLSRLAAGDPCLPRIARAAGNLAKLAVNAAAVGEVDHAGMAEARLEHLVDGGFLLAIVGPQEAGKSTLIRACLKAASPRDARLDRPAVIRWFRPAVPGRDNIAGAPGLIAALPGEGHGPPVHMAELPGLATLPDVELATIAMPRTAPASCAIGAAVACVDGAVIMVDAKSLPSHEQWTRLRASLAHVPPDRLVVALNKIDLVPAEQQDGLRDKIGRRVRDLFGTSLPVVALSAGEAAARTRATLVGSGALGLRKAVRTVLRQPRATARIDSAEALVRILASQLHAALGRRRVRLDEGSDAHAARLADLRGELDDVTDRFHDWLVKLKEREDSLNTKIGTRMAEFAKQMAADADGILRAIPFTRSHVASTVYCRNELRRNSVDQLAACYRERMGEVRKETEQALLEISVDLAQHSVCWDKAVAANLISLDGQDAAGPDPGRYWRPLMDKVETALGSMLDSGTAFSTAYQRRCAPPWYSDLANWWNRKWGGSEDQIIEQTRARCTGHLKAVVRSSLAEARGREACLQALGVAFQRIKDLATELWERVPGRLEERKFTLKHQAEIAEAEYSQSLARIDFVIRFCERLERETDKGA